MDDRPKSNKLKCVKFMVFSLSCFFIVSCETPTILKAPPTSYQDKYFQVSDEIINGSEISTTVEIKEKSVLFFLDTARISFREDFIIRVEEYKNKLKVFCGEVPEHEYVDHALVFEWKDTFLHLTEESPTGINDEIGTIYLGKFTNIKYLREDYYKMGDRDSY
jgi:hypothetical protein